MPGFTKLFSEIVTSSVWNEEDKTRIVWVTMMASCDALGMVRASVSGLAHIARVDRASCERALEILSSPDSDSRSPEFEGRRIRKVDGGWLLLNYVKYRDAKSEDERKAYMANYMREYRAKKSVSKPVNNCNGLLAGVNTDKEGVNKSGSRVNLPPSSSSPTPPSTTPPIAEAEAEAELLLGTEIEKVPETRKGSAEGEPPAKPDRLPTTEIPIRIAKLFRRRLTTPWSEKEFASFKKAGPIESSDMDLIEKYYAAERKKGRGPQGGIHRSDLPTFLNNFRGELDRATAMFAKKSNSGDQEEFDPQMWRDRAAYDAYWAKRGRITT